ncbi:phosphotransferase [Hwanghaeella sp.]|uniref:phosphotransferase n=1 Tax=Hwanghaeella sp. TaxID=2605943 RepID=UPI003CCC0941
MKLIDQIPALAAAVSTLSGFVPVTAEELIPLPTTGLAHDHIRIGGTAMLLRVPRQSQLALAARDNLAYQAACFRRMEPSGHTPKLFAVIDPVPDIPMGALVVEEIRGRTMALPAGLGNAARALAAIHALPVPPADRRAPLKDPENAVNATLEEVLAQGRNLSSPFAPVSEQSRQTIGAEIESVRSVAAQMPPPMKTLISFDAHPGNFIAETGTGRAVLVDLEKGRYGGAGFDLAHATLYTSTTWDVSTYAELTVDEVAGFYAAWLDAVPSELGVALKPWLLPMRRIMWLWSVTWCAKWAVESRAGQIADKHAAISAEDWSAENTNGDLIGHVARRVTCYLSDEIIERVRSEWCEDNALTRLLGT